MTINYIEERLLRPNIRTLCPYSTARDDYKGKLGIFLDANESPYDTGFNRYPDPHQVVLKQRISQIKGLPVENIFIGNGSDEAIDVIMRVFCVPGRDNIVAISPSYGMYSVAAQTNDIEVREVALREDFTLDSESLLAAADEHSKLLFLCSPNNPSGNAFSKEQILDLVNRFDGMVVVDEAYADFSSKGSLRAEVLTHPNLIVLQTLSKAWGMAALRLGLAFGDSYVIKIMSMVKYPYNISALVQKTVLEALDSPIDAKVEEIVRERKRLEKEFSAIACIRKIYPSDANFLLVRTDDACGLYDYLIHDGIIVRNRDKVRGCKGCLRITVGTESENDRTIESLRKYDAEKSNIRR